MRKVSLILCSFLITLSCMDSFDQPSVVSVTPSDNSISRTDDQEITVVFSRAMDTVKTNNEFSLSSSDSGTVDGLFFWSGGDRTMRFRPLSPLTDTGSYFIRITSDAEDSRGNDLEEEFLSRFCVCDDSSGPRVLSFSPARDSTGNPESTLVLIEFSEPVDMNTLYSSASVSPSVEGYWSSSGNTAVFTPLYGFSMGVTYSVSVYETLCDMSGNSLNESLEFSFTVGSDFVKPGIDRVFQDSTTPLEFDESVHTEGAEKDDPVVIDFSEVVIPEGLTGGISLSPSCGFYITSAVIAGPGGNFTRAVINFTEDMDSEEIYTLKISSVIRDAGENSLDRDYRYVFVTNGSGSVSPFVEGMKNDPAEDYWPAGEVVTLVYSGTIYEPVIVDFSQSMDPVTLSVYVDTVAGAAGSVSVTSINWTDSGAGPLTRLTFSLNNAQDGNIYKIVIKGGSGGLTDARGNYMKEDYEQLVRF